eukprot:Skav200719  [mRNA]  locus=scaffold2650:177691:189725:- [translate_table: standard]
MIRTGGSKYCDLADKNIADQSPRGSGGHAPHCNSRMKKEDIKMVEKRLEEIKQNDAKKETKDSVDPNCVRARVEGRADRPDTSGAWFADDQALWRLRWQLVDAEKECMVRARRAAFAAFL